MQWNQTNDLMLKIGMHASILRTTSPVFVKQHESHFCFDFAWFFGFGLV